MKQHIRSLILAAAVIAAMLPALASAQPENAPSYWKCYKTGTGFFQWRCSK